MWFCKYSLKTDFSKVWAPNYNGFPMFLFSGYSVSPHYHLIAKQVVRELYFKLIVLFSSQFQWNVDFKALRNDVKRTLLNKAARKQAKFS